MNKLIGENRSFWRMSAKGLSYTKLANTVEVDVAIVGGGISGILASYFLAKKGKKVALLESRELISGTTGGTTAKLSAQHELVYNKLIKQSGEELARLYYEANSKAIDIAESLVKEYGIDCDFERTDAYVFSQKESSLEQLESEEIAYRKLGIDGEMVDDIPISFDIKGALVMRNQAQFHPVKFLQGILRELEDMGAHIYQHTKYTGYERDGDRLTLNTDTQFQVICDDMVLATLFPAEDPESFYSKNMKPSTTHLTAFAHLDRNLQGMYISNDRPELSFRSAYYEEEPVLIIGGQSHPTGDNVSTVERYESIKDRVEKEFGLTEMLDYWSAHGYLTPDSRAFIGKLQKGTDSIYVMTGFNEWGMTTGIVGAELITDLIMGEENPYQPLYDPNRSLPKQQNHGKKLTPTILDEAAELKEGQAKKFEVDGKPAGMYKDANGEVHYMNLACTHLGCEVKWNDGDHTWDCPCHGSIFDGKGEVISGPAKEPLKRVSPF
ncbi:FAD-dependent oxidoreductase [Rummeliibacillus sp. G93]|uniref:FAD-dependent oxidoreductase n=1 Tax=Rummeliibacillus sp. G93 TaxID=2939494 RepID=UPI00201C3727|nr:FAD-dependent oxidoreductase [Rummeliibacillus sp. G93]UQW97933.1 FAD-dependent oxidoreductase [Rummeliibacillus sp. G93]